MVLHHPFRLSSEQYCSQEVKHNGLPSFIEMEKEKKLKGHFFVRENLIDMTYRLEQRKLALRLVLPATVRHICGDLKQKRKGIFQVPMEVNDDIIASL